MLGDRFPPSGSASRASVYYAGVPVEGLDLETLSLSSSADFIALIERSRASYRANGGQSLDEVRHRYGLRPKATGRRKHP